MATQRQKKKALKNAKKVAKKSPILFIVIALIIIGLAVGGFILYKNGYFDKWFNNNQNQQNNQNLQGSQNGSGEVKEDGYTENIIYDNFQIHFMELGNEFAGDSTYIKAGDVDILIDAGSRSNSASTLNEYIKKYCTDGKLEYVIATHNHQDHIAGFAGGSDSKAVNFKGQKVGKTGVFYYYEVGTLIDFTYAGVSKDNKTIIYDNKSQVSSNFGFGTEYGKYLAAREYLISNGTKYYTAKDLWDSNTTSFTLADGITMDILYNYFYFNESNDINNYSVCTLFNYNTHHFLLTGDLELEGEEKLAAYYDGSSQAKTLPQCELFKAGHHGSKTSSNECLLEKIKPNICCVCCCAGTPEYTNNVEHQFPTQAFINRIAKYTSRVYVTSMVKYVDNEWKLVPMNGNITVSCNGDNIALKASENLTRLKDSEWFNEKIYALKTKNTYVWNNAGDKFDVYQNCPKSPTSGKTADAQFYDANTEGAVLIPRRTWPSEGVK